MDIEKLFLHHLLKAGSSEEPREKLQLGVDTFDIHSASAHAELAQHLLHDSEINK